MAPGAVTALGVAGTGFVPAVDTGLGVLTNFGCSSTTGLGNCDKCRIMQQEYGPAHTDQDIYDSRETRQLVLCLKTALLALKAVCISL